MDVCDLCKEQMKKTSNGKPHESLSECGERRQYKGIKPRGFEEQDYQCQACQAKFTQSSNRNDLAWTLWQG